MATPPTFVAEYETGFGESTSPETSAVTVATNDILAILGVVEDSATTLATPTGGGYTYTLQQNSNVASNCNVYGWTAPISSGQSYSVSIEDAGDGSHWWGYNPLRFSGSDGVGASSKTNASGAPSLSITTSFDNSAIVVAVGDWNAVDGTTRTWRTVNGTAPSAGNGFEKTYFRDASHYGVYMAYYPDAGTAGAKTVGLTAPSGQKYAIVAVEIRGSTGAAPTSLTIPRRRPIGALLDM